MYQEELQRFDQALDTQDFNAHHGEEQSFLLQKREGKYLVGSAYEIPTPWDTLEEALLDLVRSVGYFDRQIKW